MNSFGVIACLALIFGLGFTAQAEDAPSEIIMMDEVPESQIPEPVPVELKAPAPTVQILQAEPDAELSVDDHNTKVESVVMPDFDKVEEEVLKAEKEASELPAQKKPVAPKPVVTAPVVTTPVAEEPAVKPAPAVIRPPSRRTVRHNPHLPENTLPQPAVPVTEVEMFDIESVIKAERTTPALPWVQIENFDAMSSGPGPRPKVLRKKIVKKKVVAKTKLAKKLPKKKRRVAQPVEESGYWDDNYAVDEEDGRDIASSFDGTRTFTAQVQNLSEFNGMWEVSFTDEPGRYRIYGSPDAFSDYQNNSQFLEVRVDDVNRRIIEVKPIRARFRPL